METTKQIIVDNDLPIKGAWSKLWISRDMSKTCQVVSDRNKIFININVLACCDA